MQLHQASFIAIALRRLKCLWTLMIQHFKRAAHVWHSGALGQEEKACFNGKCFIRSVVLFYVRVVWSGFGECPWDVKTSTVQPQRYRSHEMKNRCFRRSESILAENTDVRRADVMLQCAHVRPA